MAAKSTTNFIFFHFLTIICSCTAILDLKQEVQYESVNRDNSYELHFDIHSREKRQAGHVTPSTLAPVNVTSDSNSTTVVTTTISTTTKASSTTGLKTSSTSINPTIKEDDHKYYTSSTVKGTSVTITNFWIDVNQNPSAVKHISLSDNHRTASTIQLKFDFPFYGHIVKKVTIATGGFVYLSDFLHQWLTATQYAAPLMANFDTTLGNESNIYYLDTTEAFVVWWDKVHLNDDYEAGPFSFQLQLDKTGLIRFVYKEIPKSVVSFSTAKHPVKVGLSDAYYYDTIITGNVKRRTIYEYHRVEIPLSQVNQYVAIEITPVTTCLSLTTCDACVTAKTEFNCQWCTSLPNMRCSDGLDRYRQEWLDSDCHNKEPRVTTLESCKNINKTTSTILTPSTTTTTTKPSTVVNSGCNDDNTQKPITQDQCPPPGSQKKGSDNEGLSKLGAGSGINSIEHQQQQQQNGEGHSRSANNGTLIAVIIIVLLIVALIGAVSGWFIYAYRNPNTDSGRWLIEHRPSQIRESLAKVAFWKKDGAGEKYGVSVGAESVA